MESEAATPFFVQTCLSVERARRKGSDFMVNDVTLISELDSMKMDHTLWNGEKSTRVTSSAFPSLLKREISVALDWRWSKWSVGLKMSRSGEVSWM